MLAWLQTVSHIQGDGARVDREFRDILREKLQRSFIASGVGVYPEDKDWLLGRKLVCAAGSDPCRRLNHPDGHETSLE